MLIKRPKSWELRETEATPESVFLNRRQVIAGTAGLGDHGPEDDGESSRLARYFLGPTAFGA